MFQETELLGVSSPKHHRNEMTWTLDFFNKVCEKNKMWKSDIKMKLILKYIKMLYNSDKGLIFMCRSGCRSALFLRKTENIDIMDCHRFSRLRLV